VTNRSLSRVRVRLSLAAGLLIVPGVLTVASQSLAVTISTKAACNTQVVHWAQIANHEYGRVA